MRISKVTKEFNVSLNSVIEVLKENGIEVEPNLNTKIDDSLTNSLLRSSVQTRP